MSGPGVSVGLNSLGRVVIGVTAPCGCCRFAHELSFDELVQFNNALAAAIAISQRVRQLPLPCIHDEGQA
jgi:hypothetical protein